MSEISREIKPNKIRIAGFLKYSTVNGPGKRSVIWVQGCPIRCVGCFNPGFWDYNGGVITTIDFLFNEIASAGRIDGITFSGGEPFAQARALAALAIRVHACNLTVVTFTGYSYEQLIKKRDASWEMLLHETDLLISGPYNRGLPTGHYLTGSSNQEVRALSGRIILKPEESATREMVTEFTIYRSGSLAMTGFPDRNLLQLITRAGCLQGE